MSILISFQTFGEFYYYFFIYYYMLVVVFFARCICLFVCAYKVATDLEEKERERKNAIKMKATTTTENRETNNQYCMLYLS